MIKGIVLCFVFLFTQLAALQYFDARLNAGASEARTVVTAPPAGQRDEPSPPRQRLG